jgi:trigger factor
MAEELENDELASSDYDPDGTLEGAEAKPKLQLEVKIDKRSTCERHITAIVSREDIDRYADKEFKELMPTAQVPGFRSGRAPRKLVEHRFRKDVGERVKAAILMDSLTQIHEDHQLSAISEPDLDIESVNLPESGPLTFEFDIEVRPEFDLPKWKGLELEKPTRTFTKEDVDSALLKVLKGRGRLLPQDGPAALDDYVTANLTFTWDGKVLSSASEEVIQVRPVLSFRDGKVENFGEVMVGVTAGETRTIEAHLGQQASNPELRGKAVPGTVEVLEVKRLELPLMDEALLTDFGVENEGELRDLVQDSLVRRMEYTQRQKAREQITRILVGAANWDLPPDMLHRQSERELQRALMEYERSGFSKQEILAHENEIRQNNLVNTARALKEHFILERIAEEENLDATEGDYDAEIELIAKQREESPRKVRARLEKSGAMDVLRNQIVEGKAITLILEHAKYREVPYQIEESQVAGIELAVGGASSEIPEAREGGHDDHSHEGHSHGGPGHAHHEHS